MELFYIIFLMVSMATLGSSTRPNQNQNHDANVMQFGAVGDGNTDDSKAFLKAWEAACEETSNNPTLVIPHGKTFLLQSTSFQGPCKSSNVHIRIDGDLIAPKDPSTWKQKEFWLSFQNLNEFTVDANGKIDGQGSNWWKLCPDPKKADGCERPTSLLFHNCVNFKVNGLNSINSPRNHISIQECAQGTFSNPHLTAPGESPNTDGFNIATSKNIEIFGGVVATGDDCIAISSGSSYINIIGLACGPGHGISVGSLGLNGNSAAVEAIHVKKCTLTSTQNGLRIKTWQGGSGYARNITFEDNTFIGVGNPVIIDQFYCPHQSCSNETSAVQVSDVSYTRIQGTTIAENAIILNCSDTVSCKDILLQDIDITPTDPKTMKLHSSCNNAYGKAVKTLPIVDCLK